MGLQGCNSKMIRRAESVTGQDIVRLVVARDNFLWFITRDHRHGWWDRPSGNWCFDESQGHFSSCNIIFPIPQEGHPWGEIDKMGRWRAVGHISGMDPLRNRPNHDHSMASLIANLVQSEKDERSHRLKVESELGDLIRFLVSDRKPQPIELLPPEIRDTVIKYRHLFADQVRLTDRLRVHAERSL